MEGDISTREEIENACRLNDFKTVGIILKLDGNKQETLDWLLVQACLNNSTQLLELALSRGANVNTQDKDGKQILHRLDKHRLGIAKKLIEKGADVNGVDNFNQTPLHFAVHTNDQKYMKFLIRNGANLDAEDEQGRTPITHAGTDKVKKNLEKARETNVTVSISGPQSRVNKVAKVVEITERIPLLKQFGLSMQSSTD